VGWNLWAGWDDLVFDRDDSTVVPCSPTSIPIPRRLPQGASRASASPSSVHGNEVTFVGGPLADGVEETFRVRMTLPPTAGATSYFPFVDDTHDHHHHHCGDHDHAGDHDGGDHVADRRRPDVDKRPRHVSD
jgi:hypothetical protein